MAKILGICYGLNFVPSDIFVEVLIPPGPYRCELL
jgi:hypothetical protein